LYATVQAATVQAATQSPSPRPSLARLWRDESGQDMIEYALVALAMGLSTIAGVHGFAVSIVNDFTFIVTGFTRATNGF